MTDEALSCAFCGELCSDLDFCYGCRWIVCLNCDETMPHGPHEPQEHKEGIVIVW